MYTRRKNPRQKKRRGMSLVESSSSSLPPKRRGWNDRIEKVPAVTVETPLDSEQKRGRAILEILETEQSYQRLLGDFIGFFLRDLESGEHEQARAFMSCPNLAALCSNMEQIFHLSHQFCAELKAAFEAETTLPADDAKCTRRWARIALGPIFCRFSSLLQLYEQYVENHGFGKLDIAKFTSNKQFQQFWQKSGEELKQSLDTTAYRNRRGSVDSVAFRRHSMKPSYEKSSHSIAVSSGDDLKAAVNSQPRAPQQQQQRVGSVVTLEGYLILPIQRIPRYALLLKEIEKLTIKICSPQNAKQIRIQGIDRFYERELDDLARAYELVSNAAARMNEAMRRSEANIDMLELQSQFTNKVDLVQCEEGRILVREGTLQVLHVPPTNAKRQKGGDMTFHLFSDRILCSEQQSDGRFRCLHNLPLAQLSVKRREDEPTVFHLHEHLENSLVFSLQCTSAEERDDWAEEFQQCIAVSSQCELPTDSEQCPLCLNKKFLSLWCQRCGLACCQDCLQRKRLLPGGEEAQLCCDLCRLEIDMTANDDEPTKFRLVVTVHSSRVHKTNTCSTAADFFSLTPRDGGRAAQQQQTRRIRGPSTLGHAACFSIPIGPAFDVDEEESSRFWVLHAFSGTAEVGHLTLDVDQIVCNATMFTELKLDQERFHLQGGEQRRSVTISFELLYPPALWVLPAAATIADEENSHHQQQSTFSMLLTVPGTSLALPVEKRAQRFVEQAIAGGTLNVGLLVQYEKMAKERPTKFSILCVKYLYLEVARMWADNREVLEQVQERDVRFDRALDKSYASIAREHSTNLRFLSSHLSTRAIQHFDRAGATTAVDDDSLISRRDFVLNDLISTEQTYVSSLKLLNEVFVTPLIHLSHGASVSTVIQMIKTQRGAGKWLPSSQSVQNLGACPLQAEVIVLLQCVRQILSVNHHLLTELQFRRKASAVALVGDIFKRFSVVLKVYIAYLTNHAEVERLFMEGGEESSLPQFVRFLQEDVRCTEGSDTFVKLLRLPKERLTRYKRFLFGLLMHTPEEHADAQPIRDSLRLLEESEQHISWSVRRKSNMEKLVEIQRSFIKVLPLQQRVPQLVSSRRWFVREGDLVKRCRWDDRQFHFWLFNDVLVYGDRMVGGQYRFCRMLELRGITIHDLDQGTDSRPNSVGDYRFAFEIRSTTKSFICMVPHSVEPTTPKSGTGSLTELTDVSKPTAGEDIKLWIKQEWMREITQCVNSLAEQIEEQEEDEGEGEGKREQSTTAPVVMQYESVPACMNCSSKFSLTLRRHHCRRCAAVVCHFCSKARLVLDNMSADKKQRVCVNCVEEIQSAGRTSRAMAKTGPMRRSSEIV